MTHGIGNIATARIEVDTPRQTLVAAFTHYQHDIEELLRQELYKALHDGSLAKAAIAELHRQLPEFLKGRIQSALWKTELGDALTPLIQAAFRAVVAKPKKPRKRN